jgi:RNA ligase
MNKFLYKLEQYSRTGHLFKQNHPTLPLSIWNYSPEVQYRQLWDDITLQCRGIVTDDEGNVFARPFKKFFNIEEGKHNPTEEFEVFEKMDGSLGILFNYKDEWILATRGSFTSEQSKKGRELLDNYPLEKLDKNNTYLFEILFIENRIVVDYKGYEGLVLLGAFNTETGEELPYSELKLLEGFDVVKKYDGIKDYTTLKSLIDNNAEGFVVRFSNGDRMKIKGEEYLRLHKIMTNISTTGVWEHLSTGGDINELLKNVPDEFYKKVKQYSDTLKYGFYQISENCGKSHDYFRYGKYNDIEVEPTKKEYAEHVMKNSHPPYRSVMFAMWDRKPYDKLIWNILKPQFKKL